MILWDICHQLRTGVREDGTIMKVHVIELCFGGRGKVHLSMLALAC